MSESILCKPGYHIKSKWDLPGLRKKRTRQERLNVNNDLPLISFVDVFLVLVFFLMIHFSVNNPTLSMDVKIPQVFKSNIWNDESVSGEWPVLVVTSSDIQLKNWTLKTKSGAYRSVLNNVKETSLEDPIQKMVIGLKAYRLAFQQEFPDQVFVGKLILQTQQDVPMVNVKLVLRTCIQEGWTDIKLAAETKK